jgi:hypothetical protein
MKASIRAMQVGVRVLSALAEDRSPDPNDVEELHEYAPLVSNLPLDKFACEVIQLALKRRAEVRRLADTAPAPTATLQRGLDRVDYLRDECSSPNQTQVNH